MKQKFLCVLIASLMMLSLSGCGGNGKWDNKDDPSDPPQLTENKDNTLEESVAQKNSETAGPFTYDSNKGDLVSFTDYVADQDDFEAGINKAMDTIENYMLKAELSLSTVHATDCIFAPLYDEFGEGSGKTMDGKAVDKKTTGSVTTWEVIKTADDSFGAKQSGDITTYNIQLDKSTNHLECVSVTTRGGEIIGKTVSNTVILANGGVISDYYWCSFDAMGREIVSNACLFQFSKKAGTYEGMIGKFKTNEIDFTAPVSVGNAGVDRNAYLDFANLSGTVIVDGDKSEVVIP